MKHWWYPLGRPPGRLIEDTCPRHRRFLALPIGADDPASPTPIDNLVPVQQRLWIDNVRSRCFLDDLLGASGEGGDGCRSQRHSGCARWCA